MVIMVVKTSFSIQAWPYAGNPGGLCEDLCEDLVNLHCITKHVMGSHVIKQSYHYGLSTIKLLAPS